MADAQQIFYDRGSQGVFAYFNTIDAYSTKFAGFQTDSKGLGLNGAYYNNVYAV
jgi:hypothetical protein